MVDPRFVELLTKELTEELTLAEKQELEQLMLQNQQHKKQSAIIKEYWNSDKTEYKATAASFKKVLDAINRIEQPFDIDNNNENKTKRLWPAVMYWAAALVLCACLYVWYLSASNYRQNILASNWQKEITKPRKKERLTLPDGTIVTLNSATTFKYPLSFGSKTREVYLDGEAFFEVAKDRKHPFIIHTKEMNIKVLGTAFNVKAYEGESHSETSLIHGSIEVTLNDRISNRIILTPHDKLIVQNNSSKQNKTNTPIGSNTQTTAIKGTQYSLTNLTYSPSIDSAAVETLWLKNKLVFENEDFESIAADMERWYGIKIVFQHEELKGIRFTANFTNETPLQVLESLRITDYFHFKKKGSFFYISK